MQSNFRNLFVLIATTLAVETSSFGSAAPVEVASLPPDAKLLELAKNRFNGDIWPAEEKLFRAAANGEDADCSQGVGVEADPAKAADWKTERVIRSDRLNWLCTDPAASELVSPRGISIIGARIDSVLNLQWARVTYPLQMTRCAFTGKLNLERSHLRSLNLQTTFVKDLAAAGLNVDESVTMSDGFKAEGKVEIMNATIGGNFECHAGQFIGAEGIALDASSAKIGSNVSLGGAHFEGEVDFNDATISGIFQCDGGQFTNAKGEALRLDSVKIDRNLFLRGAKFQGRVWLYNANIGGNFECSGGSFTGSQDGALNANSAKIGSNVYLGQSRFEGGVDFSGATIGGNLACDGGTFANKKGYALRFDSARIDRNVFLRDHAGFEGGVWLFNANIGGNFECSGGTFTGSQDDALNADSAKIGSDVSLGQSRFEGGVDFSRATIGGNLACDGGTFANKKGYALSFDSAKIDRNVFLRDHAGFEGGVWLFNANIGGNFECSGGTFTGSEKGALDASSAKIGSNVYLNASFAATRKVAVGFQAATIGGDLICSGGTFAGSEKGALNAISAKIGSNVSLGQARFEGGVDFGGATIGGNLACDGGTFANKKGYALSFDSAKIDRNVFLRDHAGFEGGVWLYNAWIGGNFECSRSIFKGIEKRRALSATSAKIGSDVSLDDSRCEATADVAVTFREATIGGDLNCKGSQFAACLVALDAETTKIEHDVFCMSHFEGKEEVHFQAEGAVVFNGATIGGNFACDGGTFANKKGYALSFDSAKIDRNVFLRNHASFEGGVWLYNAWIGGNFECSGATFNGVEKQAALNAISAKIGSDVYLNNGFTAEGAVIFENGRVGHIFVLEKIGRSDRFKLDLQFAKVGILLNDEKSWPKKGNLLLHGFVYDVIDEKARPEDARIQVQWLHRQSDQFLSQPYEQLAATLRGMGLQEEAVNVMIAKNTDAGRHSQGNPWNWFWYHVFGKLISYGYRPWPALLVSVVIIAIGTFVFKLGYESEIIIPTSDNAYRVGTRGRQRLKETYPKFNALIYSLETFVPLVKLAVEQYWIPSANRGGTIRAGKLVLTRTGGLLRCYLWFHIIAGWILTTLWVGGFTGLLKT